MSDKPECWLSYNNREEVLQLPIVPYFTLSTSQNNHTVSVNAVGDVNLPGMPGLATMTLESFFPHVGHNYAFCAYSPTPDPWECVKLIEKWRQSRRPIRVIFTGTNVNMAMLIERFDYGLNDHTTDVDWKLELKEYRFPSQPVPAAAYPVTTQTAVSMSHMGVTEWRITKGDTLTGIALAVFGDSTKWRDIYDYNRAIITDPNSLKNLAGKTIPMPKINVG